MDIEIEIHIDEYVPYDHGDKFATLGIACNLRAPSHFIEHEEFSTKFSKPLSVCEVRAVLANVGEAVTDFSIVEM